MRKIYSEDIIWPTILLIVLIVISENANQTFTNVWDYYYSNPNKETTGSVVRSAVVSGGRFGAMHFKFRYSYYVDNKIYFSRQISYGYDALEPEELQRKYPNGKNLKVFYDSSKPQYSTLVKATVGTYVYVTIIGIVVFYVFMLLVSINPWQRNPNKIE